MYNKQPLITNNKQPTPNDQQLTTIRTVLNIVSLKNKHLFSHGYGMTMKTANNISALHLWRSRRKISFRNTTFVTGVSTITFSATKISNILMSGTYENYIINGDYSSWWVLHFWHACCFSIPVPTHMETTSAQRTPWKHTSSSNTEPARRVCRPRNISRFFFGDQGILIMNIGTNSNLVTAVFTN